MADEGEDVLPAEAENVPLAGEAVAAQTSLPVVAKDGLGGDVEKARDAARLPERVIGAPRIVRGHGERVCLAGGRTHARVSIATAA